MAKSDAGQGKGADWVTVGANVKLREEGDKLTIVVDLSERLGESASGKSVRVASTGGNISLPRHPAVKLGLNLYVKKE